MEQKRTRVITVGLIALGAQVHGFQSIVRPSFTNMEELIAEFGDGFDWANHEVHTDDGYILNVFRLLPPGYDSENGENYAWGEPVFIQHGIASQGSFWLRNLVDGMDSLPIALAKAGYDVWLGNNRGNQFAIEHEQLDYIDDEPQYWNFSYPEMGIYDLPAMLAMVREETQEKYKIRYIGWSSGTTQLFYAMQSPISKLFMEESLLQAIALAPTFIPKVDEELSLGSFKYTLITEGLEEFTDFDYQMFGPKYEERVQDMCGRLDELSPIDEICEDLRSLDEVNDKNGRQGFDAVSTKLLLHYAQNFIMNRFQEFQDDWSIWANNETDLINVEEISNVPITHVFGSNDSIASLEFQKELMFKVSAEQTIKFLPGYDHSAFQGNEPDNSMQEVIFAAFNGDKESDSVWTDFVHKKAAEATDTIEEADTKSFSWTDWFM